MNSGVERVGCSEAYAVYENLTEEEKKKVPANFLEYLERGRKIEDKSLKADVENEPVSSYGWSLILKIAEFITTK